MFLFYVFLLCILVISYFLDDERKDSYEDCEDCDYFVDENYF